MAFLGGLSGIGSLAGGITQGIGQGFNVDQYLANVQAQKLAGQILSGFGGQGAQPPNLVGGGQTGSGASQPMGGLAAAAGATPVGSQAMPSGSPAASPPNLFGGGSTVPGLPAGPGVAQPTSPLSSQQPGLWNPQQAQPQTSPQGPQMMMQSQGQQQQPPPFDASGRMGGAQQQFLTVPQAMQLAERVAPNSSPRSRFLAMTELAKGGMVNFGGITPYQMQELALRSGLTQAEINNFADESRHRIHMEDIADQSAVRSDTRMADTDARTNRRLDQSAEREDYQIARQEYTDSEKELTDARAQLGRVRSLIANATDPDNVDAATKQEAKDLPDQIKTLEAARNRAKTAYETFQQQRQGGSQQRQDLSEDESKRQSIDNAKQAIKVNPSAKDAIIKKLQADWPGVDTSGL